MVVKELITRLGFDLDDAQLKLYQQRLNAVKGGVGSVSKGLSGLAKLAVGAFATAGITALGKSILDTTGEVEQYRVALGRMVGDQIKANKIIENIDWGRETGEIDPNTGKKLRGAALSDFYGTANSVGGLQGLVTFGMQAEQAEDVLYRLGDVAQGNSEAFKSLALNMGQVYAKGKADGTDLKQFIGQGMDVVGEVSKITGKSRAEIEKAGVTYEQCAMALKSLTSEGGKYFEMMQAQGNTWPGLVKKFQSMIAGIKEYIGQGVMNNVKSLMQHIYDDIDGYREKIIEIGTAIFNKFLWVMANIYVAFVELKAKTGMFKGVRSLLDSIVNVLKVFGRVLLVAFMTAVPIIDKVAGAISKVINALVKNKAWVVEFGKIALAVILGIKAAVGSIMLVNKIKDVMALTNSFFGLLKANPAAIVIGAIVIALVLLLTHLDEIKAWWKNSGLAGKIAGIAVALASVISTVIALKKVISGLKLMKQASDFFNLIKTNPTVFIIMAIAGALLFLILNWHKMSDEVKTFIKVVGVIAGIAGVIFGIIQAIKAFNTIMMVARAIFLAFNIICAANPIILIVMAVIAAIALLIGLTVLIVKNWDKIKEWFAKFADWCKALFAKLVEGIKAIWNKIVSFFVGLWETVKNVFFAVVNWIVELWFSIVAFFQGLWETIKEVFAVFIDWVSGIWETVVEIIKTVWNSVTDFFAELWENIKAVFFGFVDWVKLLFNDPIEAIKQAWNGITDFFQGLWDKVFGIFTGFVDKVSGIWQRIKDFFGFGDSKIDVTQTTASASDKAKETVAGVANSYSSTINNNSNPATVNSTSNITVNVPQGTSAEQAQAISKQVQAQIDATWADMLNGSRAMVASPEARSF